MHETQPTSRSPPDGSSLPSQPSTASLRMSFALQLFFFLPSKKREWILFLFCFFFPPLFFVPMINFVPLYSMIVFLLFLMVCCIHSSPFVHFVILSLIYYQNRLFPSRIKHPFFFFFVSKYLNDSLFFFVPSYPLTSVCWDGLFSPFVVWR